MRLNRLAITALLLCLAPLHGAADPLITKTYTYFNISGTTGAELERELAKHGPKLTETGARHPGVTKIKLGGSVDYKLLLDDQCEGCDGSQSPRISLLSGLRNLLINPFRAAGSGDARCVVTEAKVRLETQLTLPRWTNRNHASRETVLVWDTLSSDIKRHEERHAEIARQYARELEKALEELYPEPTCEKMKARVEATSKRIIEAHAADQERFDRVEAASFERRMLRMLDFKAQRLHSGN